jgi:ATP-dependent exoDNAse (exonuclease V) alpha subunit
MNREKLVALDGKEEVLISMTKQLQKVDERRVVSWKNMLPVSDILALKVGAPILFCVNKWGKFANGEHGIVKEINDDFILVEKNDKIVRVEPHLFELTEIHLDKNGKPEPSTLATLSQFPLRLAYAITIHKSQGMSIDRLVCNLDNIFAPSQLYVALSRAASPNMLSIDFSRGDFGLYLKKMINVDSRVCEYYKSI